MKYNLFPLRELRLVVAAMLILCLVASCKTKAKTSDSESVTEGVVGEYDVEYPEFPKEFSEEMLDWMQKTSLDSMERVLCSHDGWVTFGRKRFHITLNDVVARYPEKSMTYPFKALKGSCDVSIESSSDGRLRIFCWNTGLGGTCPDIARFALVKDADGKVHMLNKDLEEGKWSHMILSVKTLTTRKGESVYLLYDYFRESSSYGAAWVWGCRIKDGTLDTLRLFPGDEVREGDEYNIPGWYFATNGEGWSWIFEMDGNNLYVPVIETECITDRYNLYCWDGERFKLNGNVGNRRLHPSLKDYAKLEVYFETKDYRIRVDEMTDGTYRYASWPREKTTATKPDIIIRGGQYIREKAIYIFENDGYTYKVCDKMNHLISDDNAVDGLTVEKAGKVLLRQGRI